MRIVTLIYAGSGRWFASSDADRRLSRTPFGLLSYGVVTMRLDGRHKRIWAGLGGSISGPPTGPPVQFTGDLIPFGKYFNLKGTKAHYTGLLIARTSAIKGFRPMFVFGFPY